MWQELSCSRLGWEQSHPQAWGCTCLTWSLISPPSQVSLQAAVRRSLINGTRVLSWLAWTALAQFPLRSGREFRQQASLFLTQAHRQVFLPSLPLPPTLSSHHTVADCLGSSHPPGCSMSPAPPYARNAYLGRVPLPSVVSLASFH